MVNRLPFLLGCLLSIASLARRGRDVDPVADLLGHASVSRFGYRLQLLIQSQRQGNGYCFGFVGHGWSGLVARGCIHPRAKKYRLCEA